MICKVTGTPHDHNLSIGVILQGQIDVRIFVVFGSNNRYSIGIDWRKRHDTPANKILHELPGNLFQSGVGQTVLVVLVSSKLDELRNVSTCSGVEIVEEAHPLEAGLPDPIAYATRPEYAKV